MRPFKRNSEPSLAKPESMTQGMRHPLYALNLISLNSEPQTLHQVDTVVTNTVAIFSAYDAAGAVIQTPKI